MFCNNRLEYRVRLKKPHRYQEAFLRSQAKRKVIRAGRRAGKTTGVAILAIQSFLAGRRVLYAAPTNEQIDQFWREVKTSVAPLLEAGVFEKNETEHTIERLGTNQRIKAKTAWNADMLRGDFADLLLLDEWQLMDETAWEDVGAPMLLDNNGDAVFVYTPPSLHSQALSKARDPRHAAKLHQKAVAEQLEGVAAGKPSRWEAFHFRSHDNPYISEEALREISQDMSSLSFRQEILAEDLEDVPGALWTRTLIEQTRICNPPQLIRVAVGVDPSGGAAECGIVVAGVGQCPCKGTTERHAFVLQDRSLRDVPDKWAREVVAAYKSWRADRVYAEKNYGGEMVEATIRTVEPSISYKSVSASRGKAVRAEPISALYEQGKVHHVGCFDALEDEMVSWQPGSSSWSPNRVDALVWVLTELLLGEGAVRAAGASIDPEPRRSLLDLRTDPWRDRDQGGSIWERIDDRYRRLFGL